MCYFFREHLNKPDRKIVQLHIERKQKTVNTQPTLADALKALEERKRYSQVDLDLRDLLRDKYTEAIGQFKEAASKAADYETLKVLSVELFIPIGHIVLPDAWLERMPKGRKKHQIWWDLAGSYGEIASGDTLEEAFEAAKLHIEKYVITQ